MATLELTIEIAAQPNLVFAFFIPQRMAYWYGTEMDARFEVQGGAAEFCVGLKVRIEGRVGKHEVAQTAVVTRYDWAHLLEWQFKDAYGVRGLQLWELEPIPPCGTGTRVRMRDQYDMPGWLGRIVDALLTRHTVARRDREYLARLKSLAERLEPGSTRGNIRRDRKDQ